MHLPMAANIRVKLSGSLPRAGYNAPPKRSQRHWPTQHEDKNDHRPRLWFAFLQHSPGESDRSPGPGHGEQEAPDQAANRLSEGVVTVQDPRGGHEGRHDQSDEGGHPEAAVVVQPQVPREVHRDESHSGGVATRKAWIPG